MERISIAAEAAERMSNRSKGKGLLEGLPQDYWDFVPSENKQVQSNMTKIILSPYQVIFFQPFIFGKGCSMLASSIDILIHCFPPEKRLFSIIFNWVTATLARIIVAETGGLKCTM